MLYTYINDWDRHTRGKSNKGYKNVVEKWYLQFLVEIGDYFIWKDVLGEGINTKHIKGRNKIKDIL